MKLEWSLFAVTLCAAFLVGRLAEAEEKKQTLGLDMSIGMSSFTMGLGDKPFSASGHF